MKTTEFNEKIQKLTDRLLDVPTLLSQLAVTTKRISNA